jgi:hypothetical protein
VALSIHNVCIESYVQFVVAIIFDLILSPLQYISFVFASVRILDFLSLGIDLGTLAIGTLSLDYFESLVRSNYGYVLRSNSLIQKSKTSTKP